MVGCRWERVSRLCGDVQQRQHRTRTPSDPRCCHQADSNRWVNHIQSENSLNDTDLYLHSGATINLASHNALWSPFAKMMCERFGYDKIVATVTGSEAVDTACKIARKWGIQRKNIPADKCLILGTGDNYHGLTSGVWGLMEPSPKRTGEFVSGVVDEQN